MSALSANSYIHKDSAGSFDACEKSLNTLGDEIQDLYDAGKILGFQIMIVENELQEMEEFIPSYNSKAELGYPYLFIRIQPEENSEININEFMSRLHAFKIQ